MRKAAYPRTMFSASVNGFAVTGGAGFTQITGWVVEYGREGFVSPRFIAPVRGLYLVNLYSWFNNVQANTGGDTAIRKNGSLLSPNLEISQYVNTVGGQAGSGTPKTFPLASGDYLDVVAEHNDGVASRNFFIWWSVALQERLGL